MQISAASDLQAGGSALIGYRIDTNITAQVCHDNFIQIEAESHTLVCKGLRTFGLVERLEDKRHFLNGNPIALILDGYFYACSQGLGGNCYFCLGRAVGDGIIQHIGECSHE